MDRGTMIGYVRDDLLDADEVEFSRVKVENALNRAAKWTARQLARYNIIQYASGYEDFTTASETRAYALVATDIVRVHRVVQLDARGRECAVADQVDVTLSRDDWAWDGTRWRYHVTRDKTTKLYTINFPFAPGSSLTFRVYYVARPADIATGAGNDTTEYTYIPEDYHDLVVARAVARLVGPSGVQYEQAEVEVARLLADLRTDAIMMAGVAEIRRE